MKKGGPESVKRGPERTQDLNFGLYSEKGRSWVSEKRSRADSGPLFWTLQWKREVLSLWKELLRVSHFLKLPHKKPALFLHHGDQGAQSEVMTKSHFWPDLPICCYNEKLRISGHEVFMGLYLTNSWNLVLHNRKHMSQIEAKIILRPAFRDFFSVYLALYYDYMCSEKQAIFIWLLESPISP